MSRKQYLHELVETVISVLDARDPYTYEHSERVALISELIARKMNLGEAPALSSVLIDIIPSNIVNAMALANMLQIIFFAILVGVSILMVGEKANPLIELIEISNEIMMKMVNIIMAVAPYAVFALLGKAISDLGLDLLLDLAGYVGVLVFALFLHLFVTMKLYLII